MIQQMIHNKYTTNHIKIDAKTMQNSCLKIDATNTENHQKWSSKGKQKTHQNLSKIDSNKKVEKINILAGWIHDAGTTTGRSCDPHYSYLYFYTYIFIYLYTYSSTTYTRPTRKSAVADFIVGHCLYILCSFILFIRSIYSPHNLT